MCIGDRARLYASLSLERSQGLSKRFSTFTTPCWDNLTGSILRLERINYRCLDRGRFDGSLPFHPQITLSRFGVDANYPNEFAKGSPCDMLAEEIFAARLRLSRILDQNESGESEDVMVIVKAYEQMLQFLCQRAYEHGRAESLSE